MNVFDIGARITLDTQAFTKGLDNAQSSVSSFADKAKSALGTFAKVGTAAIGAASAGIAAMTKQAVDAYADYEQLVGGVETLFGDSAEKVVKDAEEAFKTAGMSMNDYMETSIQSAAALINSLEGDQAKAAELMNMSIVDMSDNVNKMGTTMEAVQNAYRGFSRGNFTMLDNLALGFAGTKEGMQQLLDKAREFSGVEYNIESYSDIVQAIHVVQTEMGITGTTAKEASETISGSINAMKAAWDNMKVALISEDGDMEDSINALFESALTVYDNIEPKIEQAVGGIANFVQKAAPLIADKLPPIIENILPSLLQTGTVLVTSIGKGVAKALPSLMNSVGSIATGLYSDFTNANLGSFEWLKEDVVHTVDNIEDILGGIDLSTVYEEVFEPLAEWGKNESLPAAFDTIATASDVLKESIEFLTPVAKDLWEYFLKPAAEFTGDALTVFLGDVKELLKGIAEAMDGVDWAGFWDEIGTDEYMKDWERGWKDIKDSIDNAGGAIDDFFDVNEYSRTWNEFWQKAGGNVYDFWTKKLQPFIEGACDGFEEIERVGGQLYVKVQDAIDFVEEGIENIVNGITDIVNGISDLWDNYTGTLGSIGESVYNTFHDEEGNFEMPFKFFAKGGELREGQAIIAEAGPELLSIQNGVATVTPLNGNASNYTAGNGVTVNVNFGGVTVTSDYDVDRMTDRAVRKLSEKLAGLSVRQQRSVGGVGNG